MTLFVAMAAGLLSLVAVILGVVGFLRPYNDLERVYIRIGAFVFSVIALGLWSAFWLLLRRSNRLD